MPRTGAALLIAVLALSCGGAAENAPPAAPEGRGAVPALPSQLAAPSGMTIASPDFRDGGAIPAQYGCDGPGLSPPLEIRGVPAAAKALALLVEDPDAPSGVFTHWIVWNLPPDTQRIAAGVRLAAGTEGENDFGSKGWGGPCPPSGAHRYLFRLIALDAQIGGKGELAAHAIAEARLMGKYSRK